jgi:hypothetical protein
LAHDGPPRRQTMPTLHNIQTTTLV